MNKVVYIAMTFGTEKLERFGYSTMKDMFIHFDRMYERDRRTDGQTDRHTYVHRMTA